MSILPQIVEWSRERPLWQQDALRRLVEQPSLTTADEAALVALCKVEHGLRVDDAPKPQPLAAISPATAPAGAPAAVRLTGVHGVQNVNALRGDQALSVSTRGVTVVYGDNGAGKSGYVRVLKQVCRARGGRDAVYPNVYGDDTKPASAVVTYEVQKASDAAGADPDPEVRSVTWGAGVTGHAELAQVSVFDTRTAAVYVTKENDVAYLPHGTDLFPKLVQVCEKVKQALETEISQLERDRDRFETIAPGTKAFDLLQALHVSTARQRFDGLAALTDDDRAQLERLRVEEQRFRAENPVGRAQERRQCAARLAAARTRLADLEAALDHSAIRGLREAHEALATARAAAALASGEAFANAPLGGVGGDTWRALWEAARKFGAQGAVPAQPFPPAPGAEGAVCLLCQQELAADARARMQGFEEFVRGETRRAVDRATRELEERVAALDAIKPQNLADATLLDEIKSLDEELERILADCASDLALRREAALAAARASELTADWDPFAYAPLGARERLYELEERVHAEAAQYEAGVDPGVRKDAEAALRELEARAALGELRERVYAEIKRQTRRLQLREAVKSTNTALITKRSTEVLREAISEPLAQEFARQVAALNLTHLPISVDASHGQKGRAFHALSLGTKNSAKVPTEEVLSEGEHRCTALAAFFAEVSLQGSESTVVFDDPVSSLDHARRGYVARRIIEISQSRPVLVFTHDLAFLWMLHHAAEAASALLTPRYFRRDAQGAGLITDEWPWDGLTVKSRAGTLKQALVQLKKLAETDRPVYEREVRLFYGRLRDTWERSVEELLFNGALRRFHPEVQTLRLRNLHRITEVQMETFMAGMTKSSQWIQGHDHATALALAVPDYDEVSADFAVFEQWMQTMKKQNAADN
jgi:energy-coupling factor transporter ATP-binding protein EcfA2